MVDANKKGKASKSDLSSGKDEAPLDSLNIEKVEDDDEYEDEEDVNEDQYEEEEDEEEEEEEEDDDVEEEEENANVVVNNGSTEKNKENAVKEDETKSDKKLGENSKSKGKRSRKKNVKIDSDKAESSGRKKGSKRVESMGMVFMCSSKTKTDCFRYKILGLPENKKDQVLKIYTGMRLFLFDIDLRLMYGIFKAAGPGGYNIEPKAFKSEFPSQVRFSVLDDCLPLAEEKFKSILKENYYSRNKFEGLLKADQVKKLCKLFLERGGGRSKSALKRRRNRPIETRGTRREENHRSRHDDDRRISRSREERKRRDRDEERRYRSPSREKRRYTDYDRPLITYDREPPVSRYHLPQPAPMGSPVRLYAYERQPLDGLPYIREHAPEPQSYRVIERDRDPYLAYSREPLLYRDPIYTVPPEYNILSREYPHPSVAQAPEYRIPIGSRVPDYRDLEIARDYRSSDLALPEYGSRTHYKY